MRHFTFLSALFSFGAFAASMTADLPEVVSNTTINDWKRIEKFNDEMMNTFHKHFVRTDGMKMEPRDIICGTYSRLVGIDDSFRSDPPSLDALDFDEATAMSFERKIDDLHVKCLQDPLGYQGEECRSAIEGLLLMQMAGITYDIVAFYDQHFVLDQDTVADVLTKPEMCGEGWKHGQKYIETRSGRGEQAKSSPVIRLAV
ncbi:hypothetical protein BHE90_000722 [Fusarium euwallaceae]|uniref:Uncharacterized protein n=2 Tax=Fusarium solani species complex TaxID=232080 RepID=A0A430M9J5_9HYPO|nr:hypothetical protein CEP51_003220 [Fusarium floridanum]RTE84661.1 hypothetical protein BHE90_000722 [Fusarium euwallaceae]